MVFQLTPGTEAPGGDELPLPRAPRAVHGRERHPQPPQRADAAWRRSFATRTCGPPTSTRRSSSSASAPTCCSRSTTGRAGAGSGCVDFLSKQRDLYGYIHDQTLRLLNKGCSPARSPRCWSCRRAWSASGTAAATTARSTTTSRPSTSATSGWFDGNPAHLWPTPAAGGRGALRRRWRAARGAAASAREAFDDGDYRWVAEVVNHLVFVDPDNAEARELQAGASSSSATAPRTAPGATSTSWERTSFARASPATATRIPPDFVANLSTRQLLRRDRDPDRRPACRRRGPVDGSGVFPDRTRSTTSRSPTASSRTDAGSPAAPRSVRRHRRARRAERPAAGRGEPRRRCRRRTLTIDGDQHGPRRLLGLLDPPDPSFAIVTP